MILIFSGRKTTHNRSFMKNRGMAVCASLVQTITSYAHQIEIKSSTAKVETTIGTKKQCQHVWKLFFQIMSRTKPVFGSYKRCLAGGETMPLRENSRSISFGCLWDKWWVSWRTCRVICHQYKLKFYHMVTEEWAYGVEGNDKKEWTQDCPLGLRTETFRHSDLCLLVKTSSKQQFDWDILHGSDVAFMSSTVLFLP